MTRLSVPAQAASAATVRQRISDELTAAGVAPPVIADAVLVATELLSNALRHARSLPEDELLISWELRGGEVSIRVTDGGSRAQPHVRHPAPVETNGRGLSIVETLADEWGVEQNAATATVWARLRT